jgi:hypothetical protein
METDELSTTIGTNMNMNYDDKNYSTKNYDSMWRKNWYHSIKWTTYNFARVDPARAAVVTTSDLARAKMDDLGKARKSPEPGFPGWPEFPYKVRKHSPRQGKKYENW